MAAVRSLFSIAVAVLMFCTDEMKEQPPLLLLLRMEKEVKRENHFTLETEGGKVTATETLEEGISRKRGRRTVSG